MARLYANENFPHRVVELLRGYGHDVLTTREAGQANQGVPDLEVLRFATLQGRAVVTLNRRDFKRLHRIQPQHAGIIVCRRDEDFLALAVRIHERLAPTARLDGQLIRVERGNE